VTSRSNVAILLQKSYLLRSTRRSIAVFLLRTKDPASSRRFCNARSQEIFIV